MDKEICKQLEAWIDQHFDELVENIKRLVRIPSVSTYHEEGYPFGEGCKRALDEALAMGRSYGFETQNFEDMCGCMTLRPGKAPEDEISFWGHLDVVPPGDDWQLTSPFEPVEREGYLIARGADDNKGPTLGVMYLLRAFEELHIPTRHGLRLFVGCDEEHGMKDVEYYAAHYPPQKLTMIADCGFPVCYGEKGILEANIVSQRPLKTVTALKAGMASNIVPDRAMMRLKGEAAAHADWKWAEATCENGETCIQGKGLSKHSAFPEGGVNAIHQAMNAALQTGLLDPEDTQVIEFMKRINDDFAGTALHVDGSDEVSGHTTCVGTMAWLEEDGRAVLHLNIRYCITADSSLLIDHIKAACEASGCELALVRDSKPNYFPKENPVVDALTDVYHELSGKDRGPYVMGGGTYARKLGNALGYGMGGLDREPTELFAPSHGGAHQPDEGLHLANLKRAMLIFGMGILEADRALE